MYTIYKNNNNKPSLWHAYVCRAQASYLHERASAVVNTNNNKYQKKNNIYVSSFKMNFFLLCVIIQNFTSLDTTCNIKIHCLCSK